MANVTLPTTLRGILEMCVSENPWGSYHAITRAFSVKADREGWAQDRARWDREYAPYKEALAAMQMIQADYRSSHSKSLDPLRYAIGMRAQDVATFIDTAL